MSVLLKPTLLPILQLHRQSESNLGEIQRLVLLSWRRTERHPAHIHYVVFKNDSAKGGLPQSEELRLSAIRRVPYAFNARSRGTKIS